MLREVSGAQNEPAGLCRDWCRRRHKAPAREAEAAARSETARPLCSVSGGGQPQSDSGEAPPRARAAPQAVRVREDRRLPEARQKHRISCGLVNQ